MSEQEITYVAVTALCIANWFWLGALKSDPMNMPMNPAIANGALLLALFTALAAIVLGFLVFRNWLVWVLAGGGAFFAAGILGGAINGFLLSRFSSRLVFFLALCLLNPVLLFLTANS